MPKKFQCSIPHLDVSYIVDKDGASGIECREISWRGRDSSQFIPRVAHSFRQLGSFNEIEIRGADCAVEDVSRESVAGEGEKLLVQTTEGYVDAETIPPEDWVEKWIDCQKRSKRSWKCVPYPKGIPPKGPVLKESVKCTPDDDPDTELLGHEIFTRSEVYVPL